MKENQVKEAIMKDETERIKLKKILEECRNKRKRRGT